jgi:hypothetical protein
MTPSPSIAADSRSQSLIEKAKADLAQRLGISVNRIVVVKAIGVVWPDSGLGCPQPGMHYTQVLTEGYLIHLEVNSKTYEYHANRDTRVFLCEYPSSPVPGLPGDS